MSGEVWGEVWGEVSENSYPDDRQLSRGETANK